jgi:beta-glucosidase
VFVSNDAAGNSFDRIELGQRPLYWRVHAQRNSASGARIPHRNKHESMSDPREVQQTLKAVPQSVDLADDPDEFCNDLHFPQGFLWGVSTAAHQVEGGNDNNQWATWEAAGKIRSGDKCGRACDWWTNAERDFDLAQQMGINALRLSVEWSRIEPEPGRFSKEAIARYRQLLRELHQRGIQPFLCLHHFTHPKWFEQLGAFQSEESVPFFQRFALQAAQEFGDLCTHWVTFNEPNVYSALGYVLGEFPPGQTGHIVAALNVSNTMARAHARAYHAIHQIQPTAQVGWAQHYVVFDPANSKSPLDRGLSALLSHLFNESFFSAVERGRVAFPLNLFINNVSDVKGTCDFIGLNVYSRFHVAFRPRSTPLFADVFVPSEVPQGDRGVEKPYGEAYPAAIRAAVKRAHQLGQPIYILENGVPDASDRIRPWLIVNAAKEIHNLIQSGHDVRGYFHWTLVDNFEWTEGWKLRFGLIELDPLTQRRTMRESAKLYRQIAEANALPSDLLTKHQAFDFTQ